MYIQLENPLLIDPVAQVFFALENLAIISSPVENYTAILFLTENDEINKSSLQKCVLFLKTIIKFKSAAIKNMGISFPIEYHSFIFTPMTEKTTLGL